MIFLYFSHKILRCIRIGIIVTFILFTFQNTYAQDQSGIITGPDSKPKPFTQPSIEYSDYMNGKMSKEVNYKITKIKIIRTDQAKDGTIFFNLLPIDQFGNYIENLNSKELNLDHNIVRDFVKLPSTLTFSGENKIDKSKEKVNLHILVENSYLTENLKGIIEEIRKSLQSFIAGDAVSISFFNHTLSNLFENESPETAFLKLNPEEYHSEGTNSSADILYEKLIQLKNQKSNEKHIIIHLSTGFENSSLINDFKDVINLAKESKIPIYTVGLGNDIRTYQTKPLADATGGKFYFLENNQLNQLSAVINEIYFGNKVFYKFKVKPTGDIASLEDFELKLSFYNGIDFLDESTQIFQNTPNIFTTNKILSVYDPNETLPDTNNTERLREFSNFLKENPTKKIQIIGYSDNESTDIETDKKLSLERAQKMKEAIVQFGVNPRRIQTKGAGNSFSIYYEPRPGQSFFNRRTEFRWLEESLLPYEISGEKAESEFLADKYVEKWENLGYRAYYQRAFEKGEIWYKVVLWGFGTEEQAGQESTKLKSTFENIDFKVE